MVTAERDRQKDRQTDMLCTCIQRQTGVHKQVLEMCAWTVC